jgi:hypothetical protein
LLLVAEILDRLTSSPDRIASLTAGLTEAQLHAAPGDGEWSATDILAHLRSCQDVWGACVIAVRTGARPARSVVNPRTYIKQTPYLDLDFRPSLRSFTSARTHLVTALSALSPEAWERSGPARGWTLISGRSLIRQANGIVQHEAIHISQIEITTKKAGSLLS